MEILPIRRYNDSSCRSRVTTSGSCIGSIWRPLGKLSSRNMQRRRDAERSSEREMHTDSPLKCMRGNYGEMAGAPTPERSRIFPRFFSSMRANLVLQGSRQGWNNVANLFKVGRGNLHRALK